MRRRGVERHVVFVGLDARAFDHGLVIAGVEALLLAVRRQPHRLEIILEERARLLAVEIAGGNGALADLEQRAIDRTRRAHFQRAVRDGAAAFLKRPRKRRRGRRPPSRRALRMSAARACALRSLRVLADAAPLAPAKQAVRPDQPHQKLRSGRQPSAHCPASVAISFQFGSRDPRSRAKVQTSVTSVTASALPSMTSPALSRVTETSLDWKRTVSCAVRPRSFGGGDRRVVDRRRSGSRPCRRASRAR